MLFPVGIRIIHSRDELHQSFAMWAMQNVQEGPMKKYWSYTKTKSYDIISSFYYRHVGGPAFSSYPYRPG